MVIDGINFAESLRKYSKDKIVILGHDILDVDSIISGYLLEKILIQEGYDASFCILDWEISKSSLEICRNHGFDPTVYQRNIQAEKFILVDHSERDVEGDIIAIIDHHPVSNANNVKMFFNKKISSTTSYICQGNEKYFDKRDIMLAVLALMLDTASFHSSKGREEDNRWAIDICAKYNIDYNELYRSGLHITDLDDIDKVALNGLKKYNYVGKKIEASYIQIDHSNGNDEKVRQIIEVLKKYINNNDLYMFVFIVHDMVEFKTKIYKITKNNIEEKYYEQYTSRGNTIMPEIKKEISKIFLK